MFHTAKKKAIMEVCEDVSSFVKHKDTVIPTLPRSALSSISTTWQCESCGFRFKTKESLKNMRSISVDEYDKLLPKCYLLQDADNPSWYAVFYKKRKIER